MAHHHDWITDSFGNAKAATVTVYLAGSSTLATLYSDAALTASLANPLTADETGYYEFYVEPGTYKLRYAHSSFATKEVDNVTIGSAVVDVRDFGAKGDGSTDDTSAIAAAIAAAHATTSTGTVYFPDGTFKVVGSGSAIFTLTKALEIRGNGFGTRIMPSSAVPTSRDVFLFDPADANASGRMARFFNFRIRGESAGVARYGIHIKPTGTNQFAHNIDIERVWTQDIGNFGVYVDGSDADALGVYSLTIRRSYFFGDGFGATSLWDSAEVSGCSFSGTGYGLDLSWVSGAGKFSMHQCNVTNTKGARFNAGCYSLSLVDNYFELAGGVAFGGANSAYINLAGTTGQHLQSPVVRGNLVNIYGDSTANCLRLDYCDDALIEGNTFAGPATTTNIVTTANAARTHVAASNVYNDPASARFSNAGSVTSGSSKLLGFLQADGSTVANTTDETAYNKSFTIPANFLKAGQVVRVRAGGRFSCTGTPVLNNRLKIGITVGPPVSGGQLIGSNGFTCSSGASGLGWRVDTDLVVRSIGATGSISPSNSQSNVATIGAALTVDTTAAIVIHPTAQWDAASASNTVTLTQFSVELLDPVASI